MKKQETEHENQKNEEAQQETKLQENNDISDTKEQLPRIYTLEETPTIDIPPDNNLQQTSEDGHATSDDEMETTETLQTYEKQQKIQKQIPQP